MQDSKGLKYIACPTGIPGCSGNWSPVSHFLTLKSPCDPHTRELSPMLPVVYPVLQNVMA